MSPILPGIVASGFRVVGGGGGGEAGTVPPLGTHSLKNDADGDYIALPAGSVLTHAGPLTFECWIKPHAALSWGTIIGFGNDGDPLLWYLDASLRHALYTSMSSPTTRGHSSTALALDTWTHIALTVSGGASGGDVRWYINGAETANSTNALNDAAILGTFRGLLGDSGRERVRATVSDVRIWNVVRTATEIADAYDRRIGAATPGLVGYWPLNEGSGTTATDATSNANDGTIIGSQTWVADVPPITGG